MNATQIYQKQRLKYNRNEDYYHNKTQDTQGGPRKANKPRTANPGNRHLNKQLHDLNYIHRGLKQLQKEQKVATKEMKRLKAVKVKNEGFYK